MSIKSDDLLTPDSYIDEVSEWVEKIYEITEEDYVHGGEHGFSNVPHEQLSNRTLFLKNNLDDLADLVDNLQSNFNSHVSSNLGDFSSLRASLSQLSQSLESLRNTLGDFGSETREKFNDVLTSIYDLQESFNNMEYKYAASDRESGDALTVSTQRVFATEMSLVGVDAVSTNKLKYNTSVTVDQSTLKATTFQGNLDGEAKTAKRLTNKLNLTLYGDISGTVDLDGSEDVKINTVISANPEGSVSVGTYGPISDQIVKPGEVFYVPEFSVAKSGLITKIANREVTLDLDADIVNKTVNNDATNEKIFLIGTPNQGTRQRTYSNTAVFERDGKLYSNYNEVVDVSSIQDLTNKTVNGYNIDEAAARKVDNTIGGTIGSEDLVTSNALARHTHNYAPAVDGNAEKIVIYDNTSKTGNLITSAEPNKIGIDSNITINSGNISASSVTAGKLHATNEMHIPGGKIWIEQVNGQGVIGLTPEMEAILAELNSLKRTLSNLDTDTVHEAKMYENQTCTEMQLLSYNGDSYRLADNRNEVLSQNLALALSTPDYDNNVNVLTYGVFNMPTDEYDGSGVYIGQDGNIMFERPYDEDLVIKKVGYVAKNKLIFRPEDSNIDYVVSISNRSWEYDIQGNVMPSPKARVHDALWEKDVYGDFMPCKGDFSNEFWETTEDGLVPVGEGTVIENDSWELDENGDAVPFAREFVLDKIWETDENFDMMTTLNDYTNDIWESRGSEVMTRSD